MEDDAPKLSRILSTLKNIYFGVHVYALGLPAGSVVVKRANLVVTTTSCLSRTISLRPSYQVREVTEQLIKPPP